MSERPGCPTWPLRGRCGAPGPAQPLCSALQVIEKMEQVLEDKLRKRGKPLQDKPQGKPSMRESAPQLSSCPWRPCLLGASQFQQHLQTAQRVLVPHSFRHSALSEAP